VNGFTVGDRVQDCILDGRYVGTVTRVDADGDLFVKWDGLFTEYQMGSHQVARIEAPEAAR
jgi:hypothetical protein